MRRTARVWRRPRCAQDAFLPEGPRLLKWRGQQWVIWVNIQLDPDAVQGQICLTSYASDAEDDYQAILCPGRPGFVLPTDREGVVLVGMDQALHYLDLATGQWSPPLAVLPHRYPRTIINDGEPTPDGEAVVFGTKDVLFREPLGHLYLFHIGQRRLQVLAEGQTCSNGKVVRLEAEGLILYDIDSPTRQVKKYRLDVVRGQVKFMGVALDLQTYPGFPDGMCAADENSVVVAFYHPGQCEGGLAVRFDLRDGAAVDEWETPGSPRVTCPLLLPDDSVTENGEARLLLTTADEGMPTELRQQCTQAGCLFLATTRLPAKFHDGLVRYVE